MDVQHNVNTWLKCAAVASSMSAIQWKPILASRLMQLRHFPHSCTPSVKCLVQRYAIRNTPIVLRVNQSVSWVVAMLAGQERDGRWTGFCSQRWRGRKGCAQVEVSKCCDKKLFLFLHIYFCNPGFTKFERSVLFFWAETENLLVETDVVFSWKKKNPMKLKHLKSCFLLRPQLVWGVFCSETSKSQISCPRPMKKINFFFPQRQ